MCAWRRYVGRLRSRLQAHERSSGAAGEAGESAAGAAGKMGFRLIESNNVVVGEWAEELKRQLGQARGLWRADTTPVST